MGIEACIMLPHMIPDGRPEEGSQPCPVNNATAMKNDDLDQAARAFAGSILLPREKAHVSSGKQGLLSSCIYVDAGIKDIAPRGGAVLRGIDLDTPVLEPDKAVNSTGA
jgi:hypothetical protein